MPADAPARYRLFSWEHSYFSGKARAYLRYKAQAGGLDYEDVLATQELIMGLLMPATGTGAVPQLQLPDGRIIQDTSEILDVVEAAHPDPPVAPTAAGGPRQRLVSYLIELLADEWMLVYAFWERWLGSYDDAEPSHAAFNEQQWGVIFAPDATGLERRKAGRAFFEVAFNIAAARSEPRGVYQGLVDLGVDANTGPAWKAGNDRLLAALEAHFSAHDFVLGGLPSLADFGLLAPLYAHLFRDPVASFDLCTRFPLVAEWVERTNGTNALNARSYGQQLYSLGEGGRLVGRPATSDGGAWLPGDEIPDTLLPILAIFFEEMWPVLVSSMERLTAHIASDAHTPGGEIPGKSFTVTPGFDALQQGDGVLCHDFTVGGVAGRRMVVPYQVWMLQRVATELQASRAAPGGEDAVTALLSGFPRGSELLELDALLAGCKLRKEGGRLFSLEAAG
ncbi:MAG: glutathione S-transferase [Deltaproteobacteria bacterium]|nr:glutathione S-transferase [Deltaproteobacteria bacterium]MBW2445821.1 glutathione S-transferase [Deltaproteobacteria bacterium]